jgi:hypothetical protein
VNATLIAAMVCLVLWLVFGVVVPVGVGAVHLLLAIAVLLLVRRIVTGPKAW